MNPVTVKPASTILLVNESLSIPQLFMVVRHHQIDVASGALVFPGGKVDAQDEQLAETLLKQHTEYDAKLMPFAIASIREAFEETGVFFARKIDSQELLNASSLEALEHYREKLVKDEISLAVLLEQEGLELALEELLHFAHWITPDMAPKRFDTHFFIAKAPTDQVALHDGEESVDSVWIGAEKLLTEADEGKWKVVFPTRMNIEKLARFKSFADIVDYLKGHQVCTVQPNFVQDEGGKYLCIPAEADYPQSKIPIEKIMTP